MREKIKKLPRPLWFYAAYLLGAVLVSLALLVYDTCTLGEEQVLTVQDFTLVDMEQQPDGSLLATGADPQLLYNGDAAKIRTLQYTLESGGKGEVCAFYTRSARQDFSTRMRLWPQYGKAQQVLYVFPRTALAAVRLDITGIQGDTVRLASFTMNARVPVWRYFVPSATGIFAFLVVPGLAAALMAAGKDLYLYYFKKERDVFDE